jgi:hypothetical protein
MPSGSDFSAAPSALGYLFQIRYALVLLLRADEPENVISIEKLDDVAFEDDDGEPKQLLQFKHHVSNSAILTDSSTDLWKTLRVWSTAVRDGSLDLTSVILSLVTTSCAPADSAASMLRDGVSRNENSALGKLHAAGQASQNIVVQRAYAVFQQLALQAQQMLISRMRVLDLAPDILGARELLEKELRLSTRPQFLTGLADRLEGWWFRWAIRHLKDPDSVSSISLREVQLQINDLQEQFRHNNLPIDFPVELDKDVGDLQPDERLFVEQLRLVTVGNERIKSAISDYWRAFQQRSRWVREELLLDQDLEQYEDRLVREWKEIFLIMQENMQAGADPVLEGRNLYNRVVINGRDIRIRDSVSYPFVMRGSFHILANVLKIGWHPDFEQRLTAAFNRARRLVA